jgi:hypothetical protein
LKFVDLNGKDLYLTGDYAEEIVKELEGKSGYKLNYDKRTGRVTIDSNQKRQTSGTSTTLAYAVNAAIASSKNVSIETVSESRGNVGGILGDQFLTKRLDIDDYRVFNRDSPTVATGFLTHVLSEYTLAAETPSLNQADLFKVSHHFGLVEEGFAVGEATGDLPMPRSDTAVSGSINAPPMVLRQKYFSIQYDVTIKSGANGKATQVDRVVGRTLNLLPGLKP